MNGFELAAGQLSREEFTTWVEQHLKRIAF
jgi:hypothetical protein